MSLQQLGTSSVFWANIIKYLDLKRPIYRKTASYGHFGRSEPEFTWEKTDAVERLKSVV